MQKYILISTLKQEAKKKKKLCTLRIKTKYKKISLFQRRIKE